MKGLLKSIDSLSKKHSFNIKGGDYSTSLGGFITILISIGTVILFWYFGQDLYEKKLPFVLKKVEPLDEFPKLKINSSSLFLAVGVSPNTENSTTISDPRYFEVTFEYIKYNKTGFSDKVVDYHEWFVSQCNSSYINNKTLVKFKLSNFYCFMPNITIGGNWLLSDSIWIPYINLLRCSKDTEKRYNVKCATEEEAEKIYR